MSPAEREEFRAGVHVGVLSVASGDGAGPLTIRVWYSYQPVGAVSLSTGRNTRKARAVGTSASPPIDLLTRRSAAPAA
jgi:hypothetical protein